MDGLDQRFLRRWHEADARRDAGERFDQVLGSMSITQLVEALAGAGGEDAVATNSIATHLINRVQRAARFFIIAILALLLTLVGVLFDGFFTGAWGVLESATLVLVVMGSAAALALLYLLRAIMALRLWAPPKAGGGDRGGAA